MPEDTPQPVAGDPTRTRTLRSDWVGDANARTRALRGDVRDAIERPSGALRSASGGERQLVSAASFRRWFRRRAEDRLIGTSTERAAERGQHWTSEYVREAYLRGLKRANAELRRAGYDPPQTPPDQAITQDPHQQTLADLYAQAFNDVAGAAMATVTDAAREFGTAAAAGAALGALISVINGRIEAVAQTRLSVIAQTRVIEAVNEAALRRYSLAGVERVGAIIEDERDDEADPTELRWVTAGDTRVCQECRKLAGSSYPIGDVLSGDAPRPPEHPNCRCLVIPI